MFSLKIFVVAFVRLFLGQTTFDYANVVFLFKYLNIFLTLFGAILPICFNFASVTFNFCLVCNYFEQNDEHFYLYNCLSTFL